MWLRISYQNNLLYRIRIPCIERQSCVQSFVHGFRNIAAFVSDYFEAVEIAREHIHVTGKVIEFHGDIMVIVQNIAVVAVQDKSESDASEVLHVFDKTRHP